MASYSLGILLLVCVAVIWVGASQLIKVIFSEDFPKPFFVTYFNTAGFSLWLVGVPYVKSWNNELFSIDEDNGQMRWKTYFNLAVKFAPVWMVANYLFNLSLVYASVSSNSILSNTSSLWTMLLSVFVLKEPPTCVGVLAVAITFGGAACVALSDHTSSSTNSVDSTQARIGDILALSSAMCYGGYTVLLRKVVPERIVMPIFFGFVGAIVFFFGIPILFFLDITGLEKFSFPRSNNIGLLVTNSLLGTNLSDVLWARAVFLTSPTVATVGLSLTIPLGMVSDMFFHGDRFTIVYVMGAVLVLAGFILINLKKQVALFCPFRCFKWGVPLDTVSHHDSNDEGAGSDVHSEHHDDGTRLNEGI